MGHAGTAGLNGIAHRSDRANEVAQNTHKNPHLVALGLGEGADGGTTGGYTGEATNPGQCDTINAGCTAGEAEDALYTGDEIVIIGDTKEQQFYYHPDHLGSTAYITDSSGQLTEHLEYFPFGETWVQEGGSKKTPYLYTGKELDQETGLYYYGARYYDPRVSVWASPDPILEKYLPTGDQEKDKNLPGMGGVFNTGNLGLYTYTHHNPVRYVDPDGNSATAVVLTGFWADVSVPEPSDVLPLKWAGWGLGIAGALLTDLIMMSEEGDASVSDNNSGVVIDDKINGQLGDRGWSEEEINDLVGNTKSSGTSTDKRGSSKTSDGQPRDDTASVYGDKNGYVVVNDRTKEVVQVSDKNDPSWRPDSRINWDQ